MEETWHVVPDYADGTYCLWDENYNYPADMSVEAANRRARMMQAAPILFEALDRLTGEVNGSWGAFEGELRHALGNTNYQIVLDRIGAARAALAKARE